ncbi:MAG: hypothetical protein JWN04_1517 [Myxococcaceae bacterium]|nr:hypothetical protein [Myxococcaceae bacterium]
MKHWQTCLWLMCVFGCGGDDGGTKFECPMGATCTNAADAGTHQSPSGLGPNPTSYTEASESANSDAKSAEATGYTLETANGLIIHGSFEASAPTDDVYRFNAGTLGGASEPGFPGVDVLLVIAGDREHQNTPLRLSLDTVVKSGYSSLSGGNYFDNAALTKAKDYVIKVSSGNPGSTYTLELRGHSN